MDELKYRKVLNRLNVTDWITIKNVQCLTSQGTAVWRECEFREKISLMSIELEAGIFFTPLSHIWNDTKHRVTASKISSSVLLSLTRR